MKFSLGCLLAVMAVLGLCFGSFMATGHPAVPIMLIASLIFLALSLRTIGGRIQAEQSPAKILRNMVISLVATTGGSLALAVAEHSYRQMTGGPMKLSLGEIVMIVAIVSGGCSLFAVLLSALIVSSVGHSQKQRREAAALDEPNTSE